MKNFYKPITIIIICSFILSITGNDQGAIFILLMTILVVLSSILDIITKINSKL